MEHGGLLWALARRLINRPRKASQITRRRYGPRATGGSQHDHMGKLKGRGSTYIHACKIDQTVTVPLAPQPAAKSSYPKLPSSHLTHPQLEKMGEKKGKVRLLNPQIYHAPRRRPEGVFCHRVGFFLATRSPTPTAKYFPSHRPSMSGARCRPLTYARRRGLRALGSGLRLKRRRRQRQPSPPLQPPSPDPISTGRANHGQLFKWGSMYLTREAKILHHAVGSGGAPVRRQSYKGGPAYSNRGCVAGGPDAG